MIPPPLSKILVALLVVGKSISVGDKNSLGANKNVPEYFSTMTNFQDKELRILGNMIALFQIWTKTRFFQAKTGKRCL